MDLEKRVAVIGAGVSGLASIKACKEEGLKVVCYEITDDVGGLWKYRQENIPGVASIARKTVMNTCKEMSAFSDFPPPEGFPTFLPHRLVHRYLRSYAEQNSLMSHVRFGRRVTRVREADDFKSSGRWRVTATALDTSQEEEDTYDAVMVCTGAFARPSTPLLPGQEDFGGHLCHSWHYKDGSSFRGKNVLVVGTGNSAMDVAVDLCDRAERVYLSCRSGSWIFTRCGPGGAPFDTVFITRLKYWLAEWLPSWLINRETEKRLKERFDPTKFNIRPKRRVFDAVGSINDLIPFHLFNGTIKVRGGIKRLVRNGVVFENDEQTTPVDHVIFATGYDVDFPFLEKPLHPSDLYKFLVSPQAPHRTLAFIGFVEGNRPLAPVYEMQAAWFVQLLKGGIRLPSAQKMTKKVLRDQKRRLDRFGDRRKLMHFEDYLDDLTADFGAKPNLFSLLFRRPTLFYRCLVGPLLPYQFRLRGPHAWSGAERAILSYRERLYRT